MKVGQRDDDLLDRLLRSELFRQVGDHPIKLVRYPDSSAIDDSVGLVEGSGHDAPRRLRLTCFGLAAARQPALLPRAARAALPCSISTSSEPVGFSRARCQARSASALMRTSACPRLISAGPRPAFLKLKYLPREMR